MVHIGGFFMGLKKSHRISNFLLHQIAYFCGQYIKKKPLKYSYFSGFHDFSFCKSGATSNRKSACIALFLNKLYLYYDVSPLNKVFTTLHRSTQVCVLGSISACKGRYLFGIINISKNFFLYLLLRVCLNFVQHSFRSCFEDFSLYH